jgi:hypothetical protein
MPQGPLFLTDFNAKSCFLLCGKAAFYSKTQKVTVFPQQRESIIFSFCLRRFQHLECIDRLGLFAYVEVYLIQAVAMVAVLIYRSGYCLIYVVESIGHYGSHPVICISYGADHGRLIDGIHLPDTEVIAQGAVFLYDRIQVSYRVVVIAGQHHARLLIILVVYLYPFLQSAYAVIAVEKIAALGLIGQHHAIGIAKNIFLIKPGLGVALVLAAHAVHHKAIDVAAILQYLHIGHPGGIKKVSGSGVRMFFDTFGVVCAGLAEGDTADIILGNKVMRIHHGALHVQIEYLG